MKARRPTAAKDPARLAQDLRKIAPCRRRPSGGGDEIGLPVSAPGKNARRGRPRAGRRRASSSRPSASVLQRQVDALDPVGAGRRAPAPSGPCRSRDQGRAPKRGRRKRRTAARRSASAMSPGRGSAGCGGGAGRSGRRIVEGAKTTARRSPPPPAGRQLGEVDADAEGILQLEGERPPERRHRLLRPPEAGRGAAAERVRGGKIRRPFEGLRGEDSAAAEDRPSSWAARPYS